VVTDKWCVHECTVYSRLQAVVSDIRFVNGYTACHEYTVRSRIYVFTVIRCVYRNTVCKRIYCVVTDIRFLHGYTVWSRKYCVFTGIECGNGYTEC
jgi:hypothetical protein